MKYETILSLAPDSVTLAKARKVAAQRQWRDMGGSESAVWGTCQSGGARVYQVLVRFDDLSAYCSCPSVKMPCKHALALLLLYIDHPDTFLLSGALPGWAGGLIKKNEDQAEKEAAARRRESQAAKTLDKRLQLMESGVAELTTWLSDLVEQGLATLRDKPASFWDDFAARMVDAKLGGIGRRIRQFKYLLNELQWHENLLGEIAELYLFSRAFGQYDQLSDPLRQELLTQAGVSMKKDEVLRNNGISDRWLVIGRREGNDEDLRYRRTWLMGEKTRKQALLLDFTWGNNPFPIDWIVGSVVSGEVVYYPAAYPQRALVRKFEFSTDPYEKLQGYPDFKAFALRHAEALARNPWLISFPALLDEVIPVFAKRAFYLVDKSRKKISMQAEAEAGWKMIALSGGRPIQLFGEWSGEKLTPLSVLAGSRLVEV